MTDKPEDAGPRIRRMRESDLDDVLRIEQASFSTPWSRRSFRNLLRRRDADLWVAVLGGALLGYAVVWYMADQAELGNLAVDPDLRRQGHGGRLLEWALERARERGTVQIFLEVRSSNEAAQALYARHGFVSAGLRRRYYRAPVEDARVMRKKLSAQGE